MRILEGVGTLIQLGGLVARLCKMVSVVRLFSVTELTQIGRTSIHSFLLYSLVGTLHRAPWV